MRTITSFMLLAIALCVTNSRGADEAFAIDTLLTPYTIFVTRVDLVAADANVFEAWATDRIKSSALLPEDEQKLIGQLGALLASNKQLRATGAKELWVLLDLRISKPVGAAVTQLGGGPPVVLMCVPTGPGVDEAKVEALLGKCGAKTIRSGGAIVTGTADDMAGFFTRTLKLRPDLQAALAQTKTSAVSLVTGFADPELRRILDVAVPPVPLGASTLDQLLTKTDWIAWSLDTVTPKGPQFGKLVVRAGNVDDAPTIRDALKAGLQLLQQGMPKEARKTYDPLVARAAPTAQGNVITADLAWGPAEFDKLAAPMIQSFVQARKSVETVKSQSNIRQLLMTCVMFANDNKGVWPASLQDAAEAAGLGGMQFNLILTNPRSAAAGAGYVYVQPPKLAGADRVVIYELLPAGTPKLNVGYADGHAVQMAVEALKAEMEAQKLPPFRALP